MSRRDKPVALGADGGSGGSRGSAPGEPASTALCGILVVDKPEGISSMAAVSVVRRRAHGARTGHAGTLDPLASGVLVLGIGRATKALGQLMATDKRYRTAIDLSAFTSTDDCEGELEPVEVARPPSRDEVEQALRRFEGGTLQRPPAFSAVKVGGRRAYKLARRGRPPELAPRPVQVHDLRLAEYAWPIAMVEIHCAKGLYVRSLARDLGTALGTGGHCRSIRRTAVGPFTLADARPLDPYADLPPPLEQSDLLDVETALHRAEQAEGETLPQGSTEAP